MSTFRQWSRGVRGALRSWLGGSYRAAHGSRSGRLPDVCRGTAMGELTNCKTVTSTAAAAHDKCVAWGRPACLRHKISVLRTAPFSLRQRLSSQS